MKRPRDRFSGERDGGLRVTQRSGIAAVGDEAWRFSYGSSDTLPERLERRSNCETKSNGEIVVSPGLVVVKGDCAPTDRTREVLPAVVVVPGELATFDFEIEVLLVTVVIQRGERASNVAGLVMIVDVHRPGSHIATEMKVATHSIVVDCGCSLA